MNRTTITNIIYAVLVVLAVLGEQFNFLPHGFSQVIIAAVAGHAAGNDTLVVSSKPQAIPTEKNDTAFVDETQG
jgi:hypothetical protein